MLQLALLHRLDNLVDEEGNKINRRLGLSSKNNKYSCYDPSGTEILQIWILLLNSGHLPYTFASERAILSSCLNNDNLRNILCESLPENMKNHFDLILRREDIYSIHKILTSFYLQYYKFNSIPRIPPVHITFLQKIFDMYMNVNSKNQSLHNIFQRIRQLSFLFLDSQYSPFPLDFDISKIFLNLNDYVTDLFIKQNSQIVKTLDSFEDFLSVNMYHSGDTLREFGHHTRVVEKRIENANIQTKDSFYQFLMNDDNFSLNSYKWNKAPYFHVLFDISPCLEYELLNESFNSHFSISAENHMRNHYNNNLCELTLHKSPTLRHMAMTLACNTESLTENTKIITTFLRDVTFLNDISEGIKYEMENPWDVDDVPEEYKYLDSNEIERRENVIDTVIENIFQEIYKKLIEDTLGYIIEDETFIEFKDKHVKNPIIPVKVTTDVENIIEKIQRRQLQEDSRWHELETLKYTLKDSDLSPPFLLSLSSIIIYNSQRDIAEIDGLAVDIKDKNLKILLMEAKDQYNGDTASKKALKNKINNAIHFKGNLNPDIKKINSSKAKGAYCSFEINE